MRTVLVTGSSTGIGAACVARLAAGGWTVFAGVRRDEDGDRLKADATGDVRPVILDVTNREHVRAVMGELGAELGTRGLQGLVNNAGVGGGGPVEYADEATWRWVFEVNLFGVVAVTQAAIPLLRTGRGRIVHIGSTGGRVASPGLAAYSASKHAIEALAEAQRHEFALSGTPIAVSLVEPGEVATPIWDKGDRQIDEIAQSLGDEGRQRYGWLLDQTRGFMDEGRTRGITPDAVARVVEQALTGNRPRARYLVGPDAKLMGHLLPRVPDRVRDAMVRAGARRWARRGRKLRR